jgi:hypothetical protein
VMRMEGRGVWVCIAPWNFPARHLSGQVSAALVAGNSVVASPRRRRPRSRPMRSSSPIAPACLATCWCSAAAAEAGPGADGEMPGSRASLWWLIQQRSRANAGMCCYSSPRHRSPAA